MIRAITLLRRGFLALLVFFGWPNYTSGRKTGRKRAGRLRNRPFSARFPPASIVWPTKKYQKCQKASA